MASYSAAQAVHKTLSGSTVDIVTLTGSWKSITVTNYDATNKLYVTFAFGGRTATTPVAAANETFAVPVSSAKTFRFGIGPTSVQVLGNGGAYDVEGF